MISRLTRPALLIVATAALGACSMYDDGYGRGVVSVGYSSGGYYPYASRYDRNPYYGWYDGFYYPGTGYYVYDRQGSRHRWSDRHRRYWEARRGNRQVRENWGAWRGEQFSGRRGEGQWQGRDQRRQGERWQGGRGRDEHQNWQGNRNREDRGGWQGRGSGRQVAPQRAAPQRAVPQRAAPARPAPQRAAPAQRRVDRAREFGRSKDKRRD